MQKGKGKEIKTPVIYFARLSMIIQFYFKNTETRNQSKYTYDIRREHSFLHQMHVAEVRKKEIMRDISAEREKK